MTPKPRSRIIRALARRLATDLSLEIPVDVVQVCSSHKLEIEYRSLSEATDSMLLLDLRVIVVHSGSPATRKRFSIAHELGHYFLHSSEAVLDSADLTPGELLKIKEREADIFAAELLMPKDLMRKTVQSQKWTIEALARHAAVSPEALWYQLKDLRLQRYIL